MTGFTIFASLTTGAATIGVGLFCIKMAKLSRERFFRQSIYASATVIGHYSIPMIIEVDDYRYTEHKELLLFEQNGVKKLALSGGSSRESIYKTGSRLQIFYKPADYKQIQTSDADIVEALAEISIHGRQEGDLWYYDCHDALIEDNNLDRRIKVGAYRVVFGLGIAMTIIVLLCSVFLG